MKLILTFAACAVSLLVSGQNNTQIPSNCYFAIDTFSKDDFHDLEPFGKAIANSRIVILGEPTHGDGEVFSLKHRLIKYLHEKKGFDVVAWEAGLYDMSLVDEAMHQDNYTLTAIEDLGLLSFWKRNAQIRPILQYIKSSKKTSNPISIAGFDCQLTMSDKKKWVNDVISFFSDQRLRKVILSQELKNQFVTGYDNLWGTGKSTSKEYREMVALLDTLSSLLQLHESILINVHGKSMLALMSRTINDQITQNRYFADLLGKKFDVSMNNPRDMRMAENMLWLAKTKYKGKKIIFLMASLHGLFKPEVIMDSTGQSRLKGFVSAGKVFYSNIREPIFSAGFTAIGGSYGTIFQKEAAVLTSPQQNSIEGFFDNCNGELFLLNLNCKHFKNKKFKARPLGYDFIETDWSKQMNVLFVFRSMTPAIRIRE
jgi:erythromycin esterase